MTEVTYPPGTLFWAWLKGPYEPPGCNRSRILWALLVPGVSTGGAIPRGNIELVYAVGEEAEAVRRYYEKCPGVELSFRGATEHMAWRLEERPEVEAAYLLRGWDAVDALLQGEGPVGKTGEPPAGSSL